MRALIGRKSVLYQSTAHGQLKKNGGPFSDFCFGILTNVAQINVLFGSDKRKENELFVCNKHRLHGGHC